MLPTIAFYLFLQLAIGAWVMRKIKSEADYLLAGRTLGLGLTSISLFATWFGAETVMGSAGAIAREGLAGGRADPFGYAICLLLMALLLAYRMREAGYVTLGDFFRNRFGARVEKLAVLIFIPTSLLWAAAQLLAFAFIVEKVAGIGFSEALFGATVFILFYTLLGGMLADVIHDVIQGAVVVTGLGALAWLLIAKAGGPVEAWALVTSQQLAFTGIGENWLERLDRWAVPILGSLVAQEALSRLLATRSAQVARNSCLLAAMIYLSVGLLPVIAGLLGPHLLTGLPEGDGYVIALAEAVLPPLFYILFVGALVAAILSTIDSTLLSLAALIEHNLLLAHFPTATEKQRVWMARLCVALSGLAAYGFALGSESIYGLLELASSFGSAGILVTVLMGLFWPRGGALAATVTLIAGVAVTFGGELWQWKAPYLTALAVALGCYLSIAWLEKRRGIANPVITA